MRQVGESQSSRVVGTARYSVSGRLIAVERGQWEQHIVSGHPELERELSTVLGTISQADELRLDANYPTRWCYYRLGAVRRFPHLYLKVIVHFDNQVRHDLGADGVVVTAYLCRSPKRQERPI